MTLRTAQPLKGRRPMQDDPATDLWDALWRRHSPPRPWQRRLRKGDHALARLGQTSILVEILEDPEGDPGLSEKRRLVRAFSTLYPQGATGLMSITDMVRPLEPEDFQKQRDQVSP